MTREAANKLKAIRDEIKQIAIDPDNEFLVSEIDELAKAIDLIDSVTDF